VFADKLSGKTADRPELAACLAYLRAGDTLVVPSLDRLSRSLEDLITIVAGLRRRSTGFGPCTRRWTPPPRAAD
jgi:DNA invertase Pin-like site-specific DNA recombinase